MALSTPPPSSPSARLPKRLELIMEEVASHEVRAAEAKRRVQASTNYELMWKDQLEKIEAGAEGAINRAEERRRTAERRTEEVRARLQHAEEEYHRRFAHDEAQSADDLESLAQAVIALRSTAEERKREHHQQMAVEKHRAPREIEQLQEAFAKQMSIVEEDLELVRSSCQAKVAASESRQKAKVEEGQKACRDIESMIGVAHAEADAKVTEHERGKDDALARVSMKLAEIDKECEEELLAIAKREQEVRADCKAEEAADIAIAAAEADIARRRASHVEFARECENEIGSIVEQITAMSAEASMRVRRAHETTDREVEQIQAEVEAFSSSAQVQDKMRDLQERLQKSFVVAREGLAKHLIELEIETEQHAKAAAAAIEAADETVEDLRSRTNEQIVDKIVAAELEMRAIEDERHTVMQLSQEKMRRTQEQMVLYVVSRQEETIDTLRSSPTPEVPLHLSLTGPDVSKESVAP